MMRSPACRARGTTCWKVGRPQRWRPGGNSFVSPRVSRRSEDSFKQYFSEMPWLAVPYTDEARRSRLNRLYGIQGRRSPLGGLPGALLARALRLSGSPSRGKSVFISMNVPILQHLRTMRWISRYVHHTSLKPFFFFSLSPCLGETAPSRHPASWVLGWSAGTPMAWPKPAPKGLPAKQTQEWPLGPSLRLFEPQRPHRLN